MAKIKDIKFDIKGESFSVNINCTSTGIFTANIPKFVADALHLDYRMTANTLRELEKKITDTIRRYKEAETKEELYISIKYGASGQYTKKSDGYAMFGQYGTKYYINVNFGEIPVLGFDFKVCIKETVDSKVSWFEAELGKELLDDDKEPDKYYKTKKLHDLDKWKMIQFSEIALKTLNMTEEKIRQASEILFNFIEQDEKKIEETLTKQKLLS